MQESYDKLFTFFSTFVLAHSHHLKIIFDDLQRKIAPSRCFRLAQANPGFNKATTTKSQFSLGKTKASCCRKRSSFRGSLYQLASAFR